MAIPPRVVPRAYRDARARGALFPPSPSSPASPCPRTVPCTVHRFVFRRCFPPRCATNLERARARRDRPWYHAAIGRGQGELVRGLDVDFSYRANVRTETIKPSRAEPSRYHVTRGAFYALCNVDLAGALTVVVLVPRRPLAPPAYRRWICFSILIGNRAAAALIFPRVFAMSATASARRSIPSPTRVISRRAAPPRDRSARTRFHGAAPEIRPCPPRSFGYSSLLSMSREAPICAGSFRFLS